MSRLVWLATVCALVLVTAPGFAADDTNGAAKKVDPTERLLTLLADTEVNFGDKDPNEIPLFELLTLISKKYGAPFVINEEMFKAVGFPDIKEAKPRSRGTQAGGQTLHQYLRVALDSLDAAYLVRNGAIEVVPIIDAAKVTKSAVDNEDGRAQLKEPLVSMVIKEKPLNEAVAKLAEMNDLTVVVSPQAGKAKTGLVTARLLNMPADRALELLAVQCDLRVVRKGVAFLITSREQANELFDEELERERQKIELERLRDAPAAPAAPPVPPKPAAPEPKM